MRHSRGIFRVFMSVIMPVGFWAGVSWAKVPTVLKISDRSFKMAEPLGLKAITPAEVQRKLAEMTADLQDPKVEFNKIISRYLEFTSKSTPNQNTPFADRFKAVREKTEKNFESLNDRYSQELELYFENLALKHGAKKHREGPVTLYLIEDGFRFFEDFYRFEGHNDPWFRAMGEAFLGSNSRYFKMADATEKLAVSCREQDWAETRLLRPEHYTEEDLQSLQRIARGNKKEIRYEKIGNTWVLGSGIGYFITKHLLLEGDRLQDPVLKQRFEKIVRFHQTFDTPVIHHYKQGAIAYFNPSEKRMSFVLPSRGDLNSYTHEMTHSRFEKFTKTLDKWVASKNYVIPFQIEGPSLGAFLQGHGGLFNLLNEVNSWRIGESFDGKRQDAEILNALEKLYGKQAGYEATGILRQVWNPERLQGKSVAYLMYDEIRSFNKLSNEELVMMGFEGVEEKDLIKKMNFLLMFQKGRFKGTSSETDAQFVLEEIAQHSQEPSVRIKLAEVEARFALPKGASAASKASKDLSNNSFEDVLKEFVETGSSPAKKLLMTKFLKDLQPEHLPALVQRAAQAKWELVLHEGVEVLMALFDYRKLPGVAGNSGIPRDPKAQAFMEAFDKAFQEQVYDGKSITQKLDLVNFVAQRTSPVDMPLSYARTLTALLYAKETATPHDWLARLFLVTQGGETAGSAVLWGEKLVHDLMGKEIHPRIKESMGIFFQIEVASALKGRGGNLNPGNYTYGTYSRAALGTKERLGLTRALQQLSPEQKQRLEFASARLWILAGDSDPRVRSSALYAMITNPLFLLRNEGRLLQAIYQRDARYANALAFLADVGPEMIPKAMRVYKSPSDKSPSTKQTLPFSAAPEALMCSSVWR